MPRRQTSFTQTESTLITSNQKIVDELYQTFVKALGAGYFPELCREATAEDTSEALCLSGSTDIHIVDPATNKTITPVFFAYLAPYAPGFRADFISHNTGNLPAADVWAISEDGSIITHRTLDGKETRYSAAKLRAEHDSIGDQDLAKFRPQDPSSSAIGYAVYNLLTEEIITLDRDAAALMSYDEAEEEARDLVQSARVDYTEDDLKVIEVHPTGPKAPSTAEGVAPAPEQAE
jgi:hypothetical protein